MSYTQDDLKKIDTAIIEYAAGERVGEVRTAGTTVKYSETSLESLKQLRVEIQRSLSAKRRSFRPLRYSKEV